MEVDDEDGGDQHEGDAEEDRGRILQGSVADVAEEGRCGEGEHARKEIACEAVAAGRGRRIFAVGAYHVVDRSH